MNEFPLNPLSESISRVLGKIPNTGHSILSPSGYSRWAKCTGSMIGLAEARRVNLDAPEAIEGTVGHYLLEQCIINWVSPLDISTPYPSPDEIIRWRDKVLGKKGNSDESKAMVRNGFKWVVECCYPMDMRLEIEKCYQRIVAYKEAGWTIYAEQKFSLSKWVGHEYCDGTGDITMRKGLQIKLVDLNTEKVSKFRRSVMVKC